MIKKASFGATNMIEKRTRRGLAVYESNPFFRLDDASKKIKELRNEKGERMIVGQGGAPATAPAGFWRTEDVDNEKFIKLYISGVKAFEELTGAGTKVFTILYTELQNNLGKEYVHMSFDAIDQNATPMSNATYSRGMKELITKKFLAPSIVQGRFFVNPDYVWSGDRIAFVREYRRKQPRPDPNAGHPALFAETEPAALPLNNEKPA